MNGFKFLGYVVFNPEHDDYLCRIVSSDKHDAFAWHPFPSNALVYNASDEADSIARSLLSSVRLRLMVMCLYESAEKYAVYVFSEHKL